MKFVVAILILSYSYFGKSQIILPGKIVINYDDSCLIYNNCNKTKFFLDETNTIKISGLRWMFKKDIFIADELIYDKRRIIQGNIVLINENGKIIDTIYISRYNQITQGIFPSNDDSKILFTYIVHSPGEDVLSTFNPLLSLMILRLSDKIIVDSIPNFAHSLNFELSESPWLNDGSNIIYTLSNDKNVVMLGQEKQMEKVKEPGIYLYNIKIHKHTFLIPDGADGICNPTAKEVAYTKDNNIWIYNLEKKSERLLYKPEPFEKVREIHWSPNGKYIYFRSVKKYSSDIYTMDEKLISVENGAAVAFKKYGMGFEWYSWK